MNWSDLRVIDTRKIATSLPAGGDLSFCPDGPVALVPRDLSIDPAAYADGVWVSAEPMSETVKELDDDDHVVATIDRSELLAVTYPVVADGALLRRLSASTPEQLLRLLVSGPSAVRVLDRGPRDT